MQRIIRHVLIGSLVTSLFLVTPGPVTAATAKGETLYAQFSTSFRAPPHSPVILLQIVAMIIGQVRIQADQIKLPNLDNYAMTFYKVSTGPLVPTLINEDAVDGQTNPNSKWQVTGRLCIYRNGTLLANQSVVSNTPIITEENDPAKTIEHRQGSEFLAATNANYTLEPQSDDKYHYERETLDINVGEPLPCDQNLDTKTQPIKDDTSQGSNVFPFGVAALGQAAYNAMRQAAEAAGTLLSWDTITVEYKGTTLNPWTAHTDCFYAGCENGAEVAGADYPISDDIKDAGGMANTFRPTLISFKDKKDGGASQQQFDYTGGTGESDTAYSYANNLQTTADGTFCALTPSDLRDQVFAGLKGTSALADAGQNSNVLAAQTQDCVYTVADTAPVGSCDSKYFSQFSGGIGFSESGAQANAGPALPYRDASISLTDAMKATAKVWVDANHFNGGTTGVQNIDTYWDDINSTAQQYGWNPVFVVALWIEESAAGGHPNAGWDLGCLYGWQGANYQDAVAMPKIQSGGNVCDQMACLFSHPIKDPANFGGFMCSYNTTEIKNGQCPSVPNWGFANRIQQVYNALISAK